MQYCYNKGKVEGTGSVGGVVGYSSENHILYSYNMGEVSGTSYVGGCIGYASNNTRSNVYYLKDKIKVNNTANNVAYNSTADAACLKTDTQFKNAVTVSPATDSVTYLLNGKSTSGAWEVSSSINEGYPYLVDYLPEN